MLILDMINYRIITVDDKENYEVCEDPESSHDSSDNDLVLRVSMRNINNYGTIFSKDLTLF